MTVLRVLTWNLFHGRAQPPAGRDLQGEFAAAIAGWEWDVALLQEVPPWWPPVLARASGAQQRTALTSRNALPTLRRWVAERAPDLIKSGGGGANAILVRPSAGAIAAHRSILLRRWPERRVCHAVALAGGPWCANVHAQGGSVVRALADLERAAAAALDWSGGGAVLLGGDLNVRSPHASGFARLGGDGVDHVLGRGLRAVGDPLLPDRRRQSHDPAAPADRGRLSDHPAVIVAVAASPSGPGG